MRKVVFVVLSLVLIASATAVLAQQPPAGPYQGQTRFGGGMMSCPAMAIAPPAASVLDRADALALTDEQKTKLTATLTKADTALTPLRQKASAAATALRTAIYGASFDAAKVQQLLLDAQNADAAVSNAELRVWTEIRAILTADQVSKLQAQRRSGFQGQPGQRNQPDQDGQRNRRTRNQPGDGAGGNAPAPPPPGQ